MSEVNINIKAKDLASAAFAQVTETVKKLGDSFKEITSSAANFAAFGGRLSEFGQSFSRNVSLPVTAAATAFSALIVSTSNAADSIDKMSQRMGISTTSLQELQFAASQSGVDISQLEAASRNLAQRLPELVSGNNEASRAFASLNISVRETDGTLRSSGAIFEDAIVAIAGIEDASVRSATAIRVFGENGQALAPLLNSGAQGIDDLRARANELGLVLDNETIVGFVQFGDALAEVRGAFTGLRNDIATAFLPVLINDVIPLINNTIIPQLRNFAEAVAGLISWFANLSDTARTVFLAIGTALAVGGPVIIGFGNLITALGRAKIAFNALSVAGLLMSLTNPVGWVALGIVSITAMVAVFAGLSRETKTVETEAQRLSRQYNEQMGPSVSNLIGLVQTNPDNLISAINTLSEGMGVDAKEAADKFVEGLDGVALTAIEAAEALNLLNQIKIDSAVLDDLIAQAAGFRENLDRYIEIIREDLPGILDTFQLGLELEPELEFEIMLAVRENDFREVNRMVAGLGDYIQSRLTDYIGPRGSGPMLQTMRDIIDYENRIDAANVRLQEITRNAQARAAAAAAPPTTPPARTTTGVQKTALDLAREINDRWQATTFAVGQFNDRLSAANELIRLLRAEQAGLDVSAADFALRYAELNDEIIEVTGTIDDLYKSNSAFNNSLIQSRAAFREASRLDLNVEENRVEFNRAAEAYAAEIQRAISATPFVIEDEAGIEFVGILNSELENVRETQESLNVQAREFARIQEANTVIEFAEQFGTADEQVAAYTNKLNILSEIQDRLEQQNLQSTRAYVDNARAITETTNAIIDVRNQEISALDTQIDSYLALGDTESALGKLAEKTALLNNLQSEAASLGIDTLGIQVRVRDNELDIRNIREQSIRDDIELLQLKSELADTDQERINLTNSQLKLYNELKNLYEEGSEDQLRTQAEINAATQRQIDLQENQLLTNLENARLTGDQTQIRTALANLTYFYEISLDGAERNTDSWNTLNQKYRQARTELTNLLSTSNQLINIDLPFNNLQRTFEPLLSSLDELIDGFNALGRINVDPISRIPLMAQFLEARLDFFPEAQQVFDYIDQSRQTRAELVRNIDLLNQQRGALQNQPEALRENIRLTQQFEDALIQLDSDVLNVTGSFRNLIETLFNIGSGYSLAVEAQRALGESTTDFFNRISGLDLSEVLNLREIFRGSIVDRVSSIRIAQQIQNAIRKVLAGVGSDLDIDLISRTFGVPKDQVISFVTDLQSTFGDIDSIINQVYRNTSREIDNNNQELANRLALIEIVLDQAEIDADYIPFNSERFFNIQQLKQTGQEYTNELRGFILQAETNLQDLIRNRDFGRFNLNEQQLAQLSPEVREFYEQFQRDLDASINQAEIDIYNARQELEQLLREPLENAGTQTGQFEEIFRLSSGDDSRVEARNALQQSIRGELDLIASEEQRIRGVASQDEYRNSLKIRRLELLRLESELIDETRFAELNSAKASTSFFSEFARLTGETSQYIAALDEEYAALVAAQSLYIEGTEEWRALQLEILGNRDALKDLNDEAERQALQKTLDSLNTARSNFNDIFEVTGQFADALGVSSENLRTIQELSNNVFGIFSNLASGNIFGAIVAGLKAIATLLKFTSASKEIAKTLKAGILDGVRGAFTSAIESGSLEEFEKSLRASIYQTILNSIVDAIINARIIEGALGKSLNKLSKEIAKGNIQGVRRVLEEIDEDINELFTELGPIFAEISRAFSQAINGTVDRAEERTDNLESSSFVFGEFVSQAISIPLLDASYIFQSSVTTFGSYVDRLVTTGIQVNSTVNVNQGQAPMAMTAY
jgi:hypothetical protein